MNSFVVSLNNKKFNVEIDGKGNAILGGTAFPYQMKIISGNLVLLKFNNKIYKIPYLNKNGNFKFLIDGFPVNTQVRTKLQEELQKLIKEKASKKKGDEIIAPMPGLLLKVLKNSGDEVKKGEAVVILEAMKMENEIRSPIDGTVKKVFKSEGASIEKGEKILIIQ